MIMTIPIYAIPRNKGKIIRETRPKKIKKEPEIEFQALLDAETNRIDAEEKNGNGTVLH